MSALLQTIVLMGPPGAGKSTLAAALARAWDAPHRDLDDVIAREARVSVGDLLRREGESAFRVREAHALNEALLGPPLVLSVGGGAAVFHDGMARMRATARVVWLDAPPQVLVERTLLDGDRPLLGDTRQEQLAALERLAIVRGPVYAHAHLRLDATRPIDRLVRDLEEALAPPGTIGSSFDGQVCPVVVHGGQASDAADRLAELAQGARVALIVDRQVRVHAAPLQAMLAARGVPCVSREVPGGEKGKDLRHAGRLWQELAAHGLQRDDLLIGVGGGATTDLTGFVASTFLRGVRVAHLPTTVLAMADASVGGKTALNLPEGKNLVGTFHPPQLVWLALATLETLPGREWRAGLAEIAKMFALFNADAWRDLRSDAADLRRRSSVHLRPHLERAVALKADVVAADPREQGRSNSSRAVLNLGHTLGHALEAHSGFALRHGEAVALGTVAAAEVSEALGWADPGLAAEIRKGLEDLGLPTGWEAETTAEVLARLGRDKKAQADEVRFVGLEALGHPRIERLRTQKLADLYAALATQKRKPTRV
jgi:shikimate kinase/3-dehydroquinate synthase